MGESGKCTVTVRDLLMPWISLGIDMNANWVSRGTEEIYQWTATDNISSFRVTSGPHLHLSCPTGPATHTLIHAQTLSLVLPLSKPWKLARSLITSMQDMVL